MTLDEFSILRKKFKERVEKELTPADCPFCGGIHVVRLSRHDALPIFSDGCCDEMIRRTHEIKREIEEAI